MLKKILLTLLALILWTAFIGYGFMNGFLLKPLASENTPDGFIKAVKERSAQEEFVGNLAMVLVEDGKISKEHFDAIDQSINGQTIFRVASISKWITSFGVMKLVEQGILDLDKPIDDYLTRWHLPESDFDNRKVTVRRLLSHTAGLVDDLGYNGFGEGEQVQSIEESLTKAADAPWSEGVAIVGHEPGSRYMYSGGGYTILQLVIEEVSGQSFQDYMTQTVFKPLGMDNSTFDISTLPNAQLSKLYQEDGSIVQPYKFTALAAASLFTCSDDLTKFMLANLSDNSVLTSSTIASMAEPEAFRGDIGVCGLGPHLYSQNDPNSKVVGHDGSGSRSAINTTARIDLISKNGIIVLGIGNYSLASAIGDEWLFWKVGIADYVVMQRNKSYVLIVLGIGCAVIIGLSVFLSRRNNMASDIKTR